jgi:hypothetical protein
MKEALSRPDADRWREDTIAEVSSLKEHGTYSLVRLPAGAKLITAKWVFKTKRNEQGAVVKYKARLVARGFQQIEGVDFNEVFAPTSKHATIRALLALATQLDLTLRQCDFVTAFLNGTLEEEVYMEQVPGFEEGGPDMVCKLHKSLYGLRQAPRAWHTKLRTELEAMGFTAANADASLFVRWEPDGSITLVCAFVDDCLVAGRGNMPDSVIAQLTEKFNITDLGNPSMFIGYEISRDTAAGSITISQSRMTRDIMARFGMSDAKPKSIPLSTALKLSKEIGEPLNDAGARQYRELVGSLLYLSVCTRPDIAQAVGALSRYMAAPTTTHWQAARSVLAYLAGTVTAGITYTRSAPSALIGYTDADYGGELDSRRSTTGYVFVLAGGAISWSSRLQTTVAVSTAEAEYMASAAATKEALWLRTLLTDMGYPITGPITIYGDNQAAIKLLKHPIASARSKHIDIIYHFARERVASGEVEFSYISTNDMVADCMTKPVPRPKLLSCMTGMGMGMR